MVTWIGNLSVDILVGGEDYPETQSASLCPTFGFDLNPIYECGNRGARILEDASLRCFQIIQGTSMAIDCRPFRSACGVCPFIRCHQSVRVGSLLGG